MPYADKEEGRLHRHKHYLEHQEEIKAKALVYRQDPTRKEIARDRSKKFRDGNKSLLKEKKLKYNFGINLAEYENILNRQGGVCAICGKSPNKEKSLVVDHDHVTEKVRGLLCQKCNLALGQFQDSPINLLSAINYLENNR